MVFQDPEAFLSEVKEIAGLGAAELMGYWRTLEPGQISEKARNDHVSAADLASEQAIIGAIRERYPEHRILSEEAGWSNRSVSGPTWIIDPLDGTTNFIHGIPQFAISIGVAEAESVQFGVILDPVKNDVFSAARGHGAWWNGRRCHISPRKGLEGAVVATGFPFKAHRLLDPYLAIFRDVFLRCKAIRRPGAAALDLAYTAAGLFDGFFEFQLSTWDIAAGSLLVEESGGTITEMTGGPEYLESGDVICGSPGVHRELLDVVGKHREKWHNISS